jgi:hypothetical protein
VIFGPARLPQALRRAPLPSVRRPLLAAAAGKLELRPVLFPDCGLRIADCGLKDKEDSAGFFNPQSAIRNREKTSCRMSRVVLHCATAGKSLVYAQEWVVYAKEPFGSPEVVLKYLARYPHRVAISNRRLVTLADGHVTFHYKDYADGQRPKTQTLDAVTFLRRFLCHVLPSGFVRLRHYGLLAHRLRISRR